MNKQEIYEYLKAKNIPFEVTEHKAVYNMAEMSEVSLPYPEADAKNLFVRDDKKQNYYLITLKGDKRADLKEFRHKNGTRPLSFASESELKEFLHLEPGSVTPLGALNDDARKSTGLYRQRFSERRRAYRCTSERQYGDHLAESRGVVRSFTGTRFLCLLDRRLSAS